MEKKAFVLLYIHKMHITLCLYEPHRHKSACNLQACRSNIIAFLLFEKTRSSYANVKTDSCRRRRRDLL